MNTIKSLIIRIRIKARVEILRIMRMVIKDLYLKDEVKTGHFQEMKGDHMMVVILDEEKMWEMPILRHLPRFTSQDLVDKHANQTSDKHLKSVDKSSLLQWNHILHS